jgi:anaerobic ribonucleoside-triphosphate reductase activating protein
MFIKRICYPVTSLGPGNRVAIWLTGCNKDCLGCMSPDLKDIHAGKDVSVSRILKVINSINGKIDGITISVGEHFLQSLELLELIQGMKRITEDIIVFSGYDVNEIFERIEFKRIADEIAVIIAGEYIDSLNNKKGLRGSKNQEILILNPQKKYDNLENQTRTMQCYQYEDSVLLIGIP